MEMSKWYNDLKAKEFSGKHVRVILSSGTVIEGETQPVKADRIAINAGLDSNEISLLWNTPKSGWTSLGGIKNLDLVWDEKEYKQIPVDQVRTGDWIVLEGRKYLVTQIVGSTIVASAGTYMEVDKSMISIVLRYRKSKTHE